MDTINFTMYMFGGLVPITRKWWQIAAKSKLEMNNKTTPGSQLSRIRELFFLPERSHSGPWINIFERDKAVDKKEQQRRTEETLTPPEAWPK